ncbi:MAG TPA: DNA-binding domain-containing protein [Lysobacter sp.]|jgi:hypothetical protein
MNRAATASLAALQRRLLDRIRGRPAAIDALLSQGQLSPQTGLNIYANAYGARLREALENDHAVLGTYLGDELWEVLCDGYIAAHPSRFRSLRDFGVHLPDYLTQARAFRPHPHIAELARFERRLLDTFDAADDTTARFEQLHDLPSAAWPTLRVRMRPGLQLHGVEFNSIEIWQAIKHGAVPPPPTAATHRHWVLWRDGERVTRFRSLDAPELAALNHGQGGGSFAGLCELLRHWHDDADVPSAALGCLSAWCDEGWVAQWQ